MIGAEVHRGTSNVLAFVSFYTPIPRREAPSWCPSRPDELPPLAPSRHRESPQLFPVAPLVFPVGT